MARKDRFLVALGVECTLSDGSVHVEQYPQSTLTYRLVLPNIEAIANTRKRQAKQPCLDSEGEPQKATDVVPQYGWMTYMYRPRWLKRQHCMIRQMTVTATATVGLGNGGSPRV